MHARHQGHRSFCRATVAPKAFMEEGRDVVRDMEREANWSVEQRVQKQTHTFVELSI